MKKENISIFLCAFIFGFAATSTISVNKKVDTLTKNIKLLEDGLKSVEDDLLYHAARLDNVENDIKGLEEREQ